VHQHVLQDFIELNIRIINGEPHEFTRYSGWRVLGTTENLRRATLYVNPETDLICSNYKEHEAGFHKAAEKLKTENMKKVFREHSRDEHLYLEDGVWTLYTMKDIPRREIVWHCPPHLRLVWDDMTLASQEREGIPRVVQPTYTVVKAPGVRLKKWHMQDACAPGRYYFKKSIAPRHVLKAHGLVGQNTIDEGKPMSHRERSKYA
jgi:hypothetical protein